MNGQDPTEEVAGDQQYQTGNLHQTKEHRNARVAVKELRRAANVLDEH